LEPVSMMLPPKVDELVHEFGGEAVADPVAGHRRRGPQGDEQVGLAGVAVADEAAGADRVIVSLQTDRDGVPRGERVRPLARAAPT
jgi:hypothetical protein